MSEREWFGTPNAIMGFWGSSSDSQGDELDFGHRSNYLEIREYIESRIGSMNVDDRNLQGNLSKLLNEDINSSKRVCERWTDSYFADVEIKHVDNDTYFRCRKPYQIGQVRSVIKRAGFVWDQRQKTWVLRNSIISIEEIKDLSIRSLASGATEGLRSYCEKIAYRQTMEGIPNTFSVSEPTDMTKQATSDGDVSKSVETVEDIPNITLTGMDSKSSGGPYSKVEQLERLIDLRKNGEISPEEFDSLKKELLS